MAPESSTQTDTFTTSPATPTLPSPVQQTQTQAQTQTQQQQQQGFYQAPGNFQQIPQVYGRPFVPYNQQPFQPVQAAPPQALPSQQWTPPEIPQNKAWNLTKIILHGADLVFCVIALAITFSVAGTGVYGLIVLFCCPLLFVALCWDAAELITRYFRQNHQGIHPGAHVALSLIIWLGAAIVGGLEVGFVYTIDSYDDYDSDCSGYYRNTSRCSTTDSYFGGKKAQFWVIAIFTCIVWLIHFVLFVGACIDTHKRNAILKRPVMFVPTGYWNQGWQPMPVGNGPQENIPMVQQTQGQPRNGEGNGVENGSGKAPAIEQQQQVREYYS